MIKQISDKPRMHPPPILLIGIYLYTLLYWPDHSIFLSKRSEIFRYCFQHCNGYQFILKTKPNILKNRQNGPLNRI